MQPEPPRTPTVRRRHRPRHAHRRSGRRLIPSSHLGRAAALGLLATTAGGSVLGGLSLADRASADGTPATPTSTATRVVAPEAASRGTARALPSPSRSAAPKVSVPSPPAPPRPVAGLSQAQMNNAALIVRAGQRLGMPRQAYVVAVVTAMQETRLLNLASGVVPQSLHYPHQGTGWDADSVGLFQQRPSMGWGTAAQLMDPTFAATRFYQALSRIGGWQGLDVAGAAQAVQRSAFPGAYAQHAAIAAAVVASLVG